MNKIEKALLGMCGCVGIGMVGTSIYENLQKRKHEKSCSEIDQMFNDILNKELCRSLLRLLELNKLDSSEEKDKAIRDELDYAEFVISRIIK